MSFRSLAYLCVVAGSIHLIACDSGGGGAAESNFITVLETVPEDNQSDVIVETRIGFRIDQSIDPDSLTTDSFFLADGDGVIVPSSVVVLEDQPEAAELIPDEPLDVLTTYTATVTMELLSTDGATLEEEFKWDFTTLDAAWGTSEWLEQIGTGTADQQQVAVDRQDNAIAVWEYTEETGSGIWANRYTRRELWGEPERISAVDVDATTPQLAVDDAGNAFAVWAQSEGSVNLNIWTSRYVVEQGWSDPELLQEGEITPARLPAIAADPAGNAVAIWVQQDIDSSATEAVWARRFEPGAGWGAAAPIEEVAGGLAGMRTALDMDRDGNAVAVWGRGPFVLYANRYTLGSGWGSAVLIKDDPSTRVRSERLDVGANGDAMVVWVQSGETRDDIWGVRFSSSGWGVPERIDEHDAGDKREPDIAIDGMGVSYAVWSQDDADFENIWANRYAPGSGWETAVLIEPPNEDPREDGDATTPRIGVNTAGNAFVVWRQVWEDWGSIWSNRIDPGMDWDPMNVERIEDIERTGRRPAIAVDENRHAHAVWLHERASGINWVRTNRFE